MLAEQATSRRCHVLMSVYCTKPHYGRCTTTHEIVHAHDKNRTKQNRFEGREKKIIIIEAGETLTCAHTK